MSDFRIEDGVLTEYTGVGKNVVIPDGVTSIGENAFCDCEDLTSITIPDSVTSIGEWAFDGCSNLTHITIPNGVTRLGENAFFRCKNLVSITAETGNPVYHSTGNCLIETAIKKLITGCQNSLIPSDGSVTSIGKYAFFGCDNLTSITIPNSVTEIGWCAFEGCTGLTSITIPNSVTEIGRCAFEGCTGLTSITIPDSVTEIGAKAFSCCFSIGFFENLSKESLLKTMGDDSLTHVVDGYFPYEVLADLSPEGKRIATLCFLKNKNRYLPEKQAEYVAYMKKSGSRLLNWLIEKEQPGALAQLLTIYHPSMDILEKAMSMAKKQVAVTAILLEYQGTHYDMDKEAEKKAKRMERDLLRTGPSIAEIKKIWKCKQIDTEYVLLSYLGSDLTVEMPETIDQKTITAIGKRAFSPTHPTAVNQDVRSQIERVIVSNGVKQIGESAFENCVSLTDIVVPSKVTKIEKYAFKGCTNLTSIAIPNSVTEIGWCAFQGCTRLASIIIPSSVKKIREGAFDGCTSLASITIPRGVNMIKEGTFEGCVGLTSVTIPSSVKKIGYSAFSRCTSLSSITIPNGVKEIKGAAFAGCIALTSITIPNSVRIIEWRAFENCDALASLTIPDGVTSIGNDAFFGCGNLMSLTIPNSVTSIGEKAFSCCGKLTIRAFRGSFAEKYAQKYKIKFEPIEE